MRKSVLLALFFMSATGLLFASEEVDGSEQTLWHRLKSAYRVITNGFYDNLFARTGRYATLPSFKKLVQAIAVHNLKEVKKLVERYPYLVCAGDNGGSTALLYAAYYGHVDAVRFLIDCNAPVNHGNMFNAAPLHAASYNGYHDVLMYLLAHGADPHTLSSSVGTPLHVAAFKGHMKIMQSLVRYGADPEAIDIDGRTALHHALISKKFNWRVVIFLLKTSGAVADRADTGCRTPMGYALRYERGWGMIEFLLRRGARVTAVDMNGSQNPPSISLDARNIARIKTIRTYALRKYYKVLKCVTHFSEQGLNLLIFTFTFYDCPSMAELQEN